MNLLMEEDNSYLLMEESFRALQKIKFEKELHKDPLKEFTETLQMSSVGSDFFEPYDSLIWEGKVKVDLIYLEQLLQKMDDQYSELIHEVLSKYFKNVREIYEFINIKPEIYGQKIDFSILEESNEKKSVKISNVIYEFLDRNFYSLSPEKRQERYLETSKELVKTLLNENEKPEEALEYSIKTLLMEDLITKIAFPFSVWSRVRYLIESSDYGIVFDQQKLVELVESFEKRTKSLAKIISTVI